MIDTHIHMDHSRFDCGREQLMEEYRGNGIEAVVNAAISFESNFRMRELLGKYPWVSYAVGLHPSCAGDGEEPREGSWEEPFEALLEDPRVVAVGETGLDYHRECTSLNKERQERWFRAMLSLAGRKKLPLILHIREASEDALRILRGYPLRESGVVHCFRGDWELAKKYLELGLSLGIGGRVTYPEEEALRDAVARLPKEALLLETDAPFVQPLGCAGKRNTALNLPLIAQEVAQLRGISPRELEETTSDNARRLFGLGNVREA